MDRELVLVVLAGVLCGPALLVAGALTLRLAPAESPRELERRAWRRIWMPLVPVACILAFLIGWALQEPEASEEAQPLLVGAAILFAAIWLRAVWRAIRALRMPAPSSTAMTAGLVRPRVYIAPALAAQLDEHALHAAIAHEEAHARHRDPLRLWLAQLATDLQWPSPAARRRFAEWRDTLELARDDEACEHVDGSDLAAALIEAARLASARDAATVGLLKPDDATTFSARIYRLLDHERHAAPAPPARWRMLLVVAIVLASLAGGLYGETIVSSLPGLVA